MISARPRGAVDDGRPGDDPLKPVGADLKVSHRAHFQVSHSDVRETQQEHGLIPFWPGASASRRCPEKWPNSISAST